MSNFIEKFFKKKSIVDIKAPVLKKGVDIGKEVVTLPRIKRRTLSLDRGSYLSQGGVSGNGNIVESPFDLTEISVASTTEAYIGQSIRKHRELVLKEGYEISGSDMSMVDYVNTRLFEIALATGIPTSQWIREGLTNLIKYHNSPLVLYRNFNKSSGSTIQLWGKKLQPIAGIFPANPTTIKAKIKGTGDIIKWIQSKGSFFLDRNQLEVSPENMVFITMDKPSGMTFGIPYIVPVLDDVRALRRLEELSVMLVEKFAFPLYHYKVGTVDKPAIKYDDGGDEVATIASQIQELPPMGVIVTSERHEIINLSKGFRLEDISPYLTYFESRALAGLRLSGLDLGRGASTNRACYSADTETLTNNGWKFYWEIDTSRDKIATVNPKNKKLEFHTPNSFHLYPYKGKMMRFYSSTTECLVTPDHDMYLDIDNKLTKVKAKDIQELKKPIKFIAKTEIENKKEKLNILKDVDTKAFVEFLGYYLAYGKQSNKENYIKLIVRNPDIVPKINKSLDKLGVSPKVFDNTTYIKYEIPCNTKVVQYAKLSTGNLLYPTQIPDILRKLDTNYIHAFLGAILREGTFIARKELIANELQELATKAGIITRIEHTGKVYRVIVTTDQKQYTDNVHIDYEDYDAEVYCFNVPNHLFVTRRNGKIAIQGNTASNISKIVQDAAKDYQEVFAEFISFYVIFPILLEGGFNVTPENMVKLKFPPIDRDELRAHQNHGLNLFLSNAITEDELRNKYLSLKPIKDRKQTNREIQSKIEQSLLKQQQAQKAAANRTSSRNQPTNQFGKSKTKPRIPKNDYTHFTLSNFEVVSEKIRINVLANNIDTDSIIKSIYDYISSQTKASSSFLDNEIDKGRLLAIANLKCKDCKIGNRSINRFYSNFVSASFTKALSPYIRQLNTTLKGDSSGDINKYNILSILNLMHISLKRLAKDQELVSRRYGFAKIARTHGCTKLYLNKDAKTRKTIDLSKGIIYKDLVPNNPEDFILELSTVNEEE
jgi:hypothetical protein